MWQDVTITAADVSTTPVPFLADPGVRLVDQHAQAMRRAAFQPRASGPACPVVWS
jgi:hypothetical protein